MAHLYPILYYARPCYAVLGHAFEAMLCYGELDFTILHSTLLYSTLLTPTVHTLQPNPETHETP